VRNALLAYGIAQPQISPFVTSGENSGQPDIHQEAPQTEHDFVLDPLLPIPDPGVLHQEPASQSTSSSYGNQQITSFTGPLSVISDGDLDSIILQLRQQFTRAGITMLHGMLRQLGYRIPREHIRQSLYRIDPVHRIFGRIRIRRRTYSVAGPNALWHHDGQHGKFLIYYYFNHIVNFN